MASSDNDPVTGAPIFASVDAPDPGVNETEVAAYAAEVGNRIVKTTAGREAYEYVYEGLECYDTTLDAVFRHDGSGWVRVEPTRGIFDGATSGTGTATVSHGLGVTPSQVFVTDWNAGAAAGTRKITMNTKNSTSIQFVVFNGGSTFASNPVKFDWVAYP